MKDLVLSIIIAFVTVNVLSPYAKRFLKRIGVVAIDQQKRAKPVVVTSGGVLVLAGVLAGGFFFIGVNTFLTREVVNLNYILAAYCSLLIITLVGFMDDVNVERGGKLRKDKGVEDYRVGIKQWQKVLLTVPASVPLMAVKAGVSTMEIPFFGTVELGILYPLILVPLAVVCVSNATNMLAGMNGLEAGTGLIASLSIGVYSLLLGKVEVAVLSLTLAASLLAFLRENFYPAKFLPGDSLTYLVGSTIAASVIVGNMERFGIIVFTPWIIEAFLKLRSGFGARSLGELQEDGSLKAPYKKIYSLTHVVMKAGRFKEWQVTLILMLLEAFFCIVAFLFFTA